MAMIAMVTVAIGCGKATVLDDVNAVRTEQRMALNVLEMDSLMVELGQANLWERADIEYLLMNEDYLQSWTISEKVRYLNSQMKESPADRAPQDASLETIARKQYGSPNINGGLNIWDANASTLALTIASIGTVGDPRSPINYHDQTNGVINWNDASRAANGYYNTSALTDNAIEITNIVWLDPVSGDGNWLIGADVTVAGVTTNYNSTNPLIYDPVPGGVTIVGPMPGGFIEVLGNGTWPTPPPVDL